MTTCGQTHPGETVCGRILARTPAKQADRTHNRWLVFLPPLAAMMAVATTELGLLTTAGQPAGAELDPATAWIFQSFITGHVAIFTLTAWGISLCRMQRPQSDPLRSNLGATAAGAAFGWTMWIVFRISIIAGDDLLVLLFLFTGPLLAVTVPLLWYVTFQLRQRTPSLWVPAGPITFTMLLQCWGAPRVVDDFLNLFLVNSVLMVTAVLMWLVVISLPAVNKPSPDIS